MINKFVYLAELIFSVNSIFFMVKKSKYLLFLFVSLFLLSVSCSENKEKQTPVTTEDIFLDFKDVKGMAFFNVPPSLVSLFMKNGNEGDKEFQELLKDMKKISVLRYKGEGQKIPSMSIFDDLDSKFFKNSFHDLAVIKQFDKKFKLKAIEGQGDFRELIVIFSDNDYLICVSFVGNIEYQKVANLSDPEKIGVLKNLERLRL